MEERKRGRETVSISTTHTCIPSQIGAIRFPRYCQKIKRSRNTSGKIQQEQKEELHSGVEIENAAAYPCDMYYYFFTIPFWLVLYLH